MEWSDFNPGELLSCLYLSGKSGVFPSSVCLLEFPSGSGSRLPEFYVISEFSKECRALLTWVGQWGSGQDMSYAPSITSNVMYCLRHWKHKNIISSPPSLPDSDLPLYRKHIRSLLIWPSKSEDNHRDRFCIESPSQSRPGRGGTSCPAAATSGSSAWSWPDWQPQRWRRHSESTGALRSGTCQYELSSSPITNHNVLFLYQQTPQLHTEDTN